MTVGVFQSAETMRVIRTLPRRPQEVSNLDEVVREFTEYLKTPSGTQTLRPIQARALLEAAETGKLVAILGAGQGKTLLFALLPTLLGAKRTLLLVPAKLRQQTFDEWEKLRKHWRLQPLLGLDDAGETGEGQVRLLSYESLSTVRFASFLNEFRPDLVLPDEAHALARMSSARSKRVFRYLRTEQPTPKFMPGSGTLWRKSLREAAHIFIAALGSAGAPVPDHYPDLEQWCLALDEGVKDDLRIEPGALLQLCNEEEAAQGLNGVRRAYRRRLVETAGIVATSESSVDVSLLLQVRPIEVPSSIRDALRRLRKDNELPNGDSTDCGITMWQHARELACGFAYRWDPPAPDEWAIARKAWNSFVRDTIDQRVNGVQLDSPLQVWNAVAAGHFGHVPEWEAWKEVRGTFEPNPVPMWLSRFLIDDAQAWALKGGRGHIVWVGHSSAYTKGQEDDELGAGFDKIPYFGAGDERIRTYDGPCAASIKAHGVGKNLVQFHRALIMSLPSSGSTMEQLLARLQRPGQKEDEVTFEFYLHSLEMFEAFKTIRKDAEYIEAMSGNPQRMLGAVVLDHDGHSFAEERYDEIIRVAKEEGNALWAK